MLKHSSEQRLLVAKGLEMRPLPGGLDVSDPLVVAVNRRFRDQRLEAIERFARDFEQRPGTTLAISRDQRPGIELEACEHLAAVPRARAPADPLAFDHQHCRPGARELARRREPCVARSNDDNVGFRGDSGVDSWPRRLRKRVPPVGYSFTARR